jgi:hypothetical protein
MMTMTDIIKEFGKWLEQPVKPPMYRGKVMTNSISLQFEIADACMILGCGGLMAFVIVYLVIDYPDIVRNRAVCMSAIPDGFHYVSADGNDSCTMSNGNQIVKVKYVFDPVEMRYVIYADK